MKFNNNLNALNFWIDNRSIHTYEFTAGITHSLPLNLEPHADSDIVSAPKDAKKKKKK
jgi:hypothetical protein